MGNDDIKALATRFVEDVINRGEMGAFEDLVADDYIDHVARPGQPATRDGLRAFLTTFRTAFPDLHYTLEDSISEGDRVVQRTTASGTMRGAFAGMPPTNRSASWSEIHITRWADGRMTEHWGVYERMEMLSRLGLIPSPTDESSSR